jgi:hypothetical protein
MVYLSLMWTTIFCAAFGIWIWYGQILAFHMLILGIVVTGMTFEIADRTRTARDEDAERTPKLPKRNSVAP